jgi:hypothetical protein
MRSVVFAVLACIVVTTPLHGQRDSVIDRLGPAVLSKASGGSVGIAHGMRIVSRNSSLELQWLMVSDSTLGIVFDAPVGAKALFDEPWYRYASDMKMKAVADVNAFEVRILTFNVWGQYTGALSFTQLEDMKSGQAKSFERVWGIFGESRLREHFTTIAYVANVRLADGRTIAADPSLALKAARALQSTITLQDLEPKPEPIPTTGAKA